MDAVSVFKHPGSAEAGSPPHWHYLSLGFSDLYGDGRMFQAAAGALRGQVSLRCAVRLTLHVSV